ncbi:hypothetical protein [Methylococcus sp. Mc7]|uniref:hypothetical protein n=1 Tax=Methylococcus sp. Mc7 TaxID=2860258 RepID=UPI001C5300D9|nr:hypothetical protein [Methylococcus sp. Mc7]QXP85321.1 hypothetical protein KW115_06235 [Methylococcus sp. Mc7]
MGDIENGLIIQWIQYVMNYLEGGSTDSGTPYDRTVRDIQRVLEEAGATFVDGGVTLTVEQEK